MSAHRETTALRHRLRAAAWCALLAAVAGGAFAADAVPTVADPVTSRREVELAAQLRCLVCQNQSIAESNADLAVDLRNQLREQIAAGRSDEQIIEYMTARYGDFVLYRPPFKATTVLLWLGPVLLLGLGALVAVRLVRTRRREVVHLSPQDHARAEQLLAGTARDAEKP